MRSEFYSLQKYIIFFKTKTTELQNENIKLMEMNTNFYVSNACLKLKVFLFFKILFIFRERGEEGEREGEKHQCVVASHMAPTGDLARNPGMCPDWESNR